MSVHTRGSTVAFVLALVLFAGGCEEIVDGGSGPDTSRSTAPAVEGTGPESPAPRAKDQPVLKLPSLPYGGDDTVYAASETDFIPECVEVSWLGGEIPDGVRIEVIRVEFDPPKAPFIHPSTSACHDRRECDGFRAHVTFTTANGGDCGVTVKATGQGQAKLVFKGSIACPAGKQQVCRDFIPTATATAAKKPVTVESVVIPGIGAPSPTPTGT
jgi:hypothetical protein